MNAVDRGMIRRNTDGSIINNATGMGFVASPLDLPGIAGQRFNQQVRRDGQPNASNQAVINALANAGTTLVY